MFRRLVIRIADTVVLRLQFVYPFGLTLERDDVEVITIEEGEHMSADIEDEHAFAVLELDKRQLLFHIFAQ